MELDFKKESGSAEMVGNGGLGPLLRLLYLSSPARPLGAFSFSGGLSTYIAEGAVADGEGLLSYLRDYIGLGLARCELPILLRAFKASLKRDMEALFRWNELSLALRGTRELLLEEREMGRAAVRLIVSQGLLVSFPQLEGGEFQRGGLGYPAACGLFGAFLGLGEGEAPGLLASFLWGSVENLATVAAKSVPLGQGAVQKVLLALLWELPGRVEEALGVGDGEIGASLPLLSVMSSWHEESPLRMYGS